MKFVLIFSLALVAISFGKKGKTTVIFQADNQTNINYYGSKFLKKKIIKKIQELDNQVEELKEFEVEAMREIELLKSLIFMSTYILGWI